MIRHHPDETLLLAYAGGAADEALSLIVAAHMAFCETCRARVRKLETIGGSLLEDLRPVALSDDALDAALAKLDKMLPEKPAPRRAYGASARAGATIKNGTPDVLRPYIGGDLRDARWRRMGPNLSYLPLFRRGPVTARLLRGVPGAATGMHRHAGEEYTLVLRGGFRDVTGDYGPGDLQMMEGDMRHNPVADTSEDCINLAVTTGALKFEDWPHKIVAPLFGF
ncbi:MAG TPA: ChrR family anti-sigma-E factor [Rhizomicrobium sp.]|nr:ChrR family anti-sigma-E factor [Rhizomicrobium sp.]